jgi:ABC-2 type transport system permease protein
MSAISTPSTATSIRPGSPAWMGFLATIDNQIKGFYREPAALAFTLLQPFILLVILNAFNFHVRLPNGVTRPYLDRLLPGLMAFNGMTVGLNSVAFGLGRYKERGILRRVRATPLPTASFVGGVIVSRIVITLLVTLITYATGVWLFGAKLSGSPWAMFGLALLGGIVFIAAGILMVAVARSEDDMPPMFILLLMPSLLFSGAFLDRSGLPNWLHWITNGLPLTFLTDAVQKVGNLSATLGAVRGDLIGLLVWGLALTALCAWKFKMA